MPKKKKKLHTINSFIKKKDKLITALGVFITLTLFSKNIKISGVNVNFKSLDDVLSYCFFSCSILIWIELWKSFPREKESKLTLKFFKYFILFGTLTLLIFYVGTYYINSKPFFILSVLILLMIVVMKLVDYFYDKFSIYLIFKNKIITFISLLTVSFTAVLLILLLTGIILDVIDFFFSNINIVLD